jgi:hypothetical protein
MVNATFGSRDAESNDNQAISPSLTNHDLYSNPQPTQSDAETFSL